jgi:Zn-dependent protease
MPEQGSGRRGRQGRLCGVKISAVRPSPLFFILLAVTVGGAALTLVHSTTALTAGVVVLVLGGWAVSLCLHEFGHAFVAYRGGDYSVHDKGYLNLDIRRYTDPVLSLLMPLVLLAFGGIPLFGGAVWINHHALRSRRVESAVSLAGPLTNLVLGMLLAWSVRLLGSSDQVFGLVAAVSFLAELQVIAFVLNILPVPGLDGYGVLEPYLPPGAQRFGAMARPWAPLVLFGLLIAVRPLNLLFFTIAYRVFSGVGGDLMNAWSGNYVFRDVFNFMH